MKIFHAAAIGLAACGLAVTTSANATPTTTSTTVATISGCYDCGVFDTASLIFNNTTGGTLTNAQLVLTGYQGQNSGLSATVNLGTLGAGSTQFFWGSLPGVPSSTTPGNLTAYDYDDEYLGTSAIIKDQRAAVGAVRPAADRSGTPRWGISV